MIWSDFLDAVRTRVSDGARSDNAYCHAISLWVLSEIARQVDHDLQEYGSYRGQYRQQALKLLDYTPTLSAGEIAARVRPLTTVNSTRRNIQPYIDALIAQAIEEQQAIAARFGALVAEVLADLQHYIPSTQLGHSTTFVAADVNVEGAASHGCLPAGAKLQQVWLVDSTDADDERQIETTEIPWLDRRRFLIEHSAMELSLNGIEEAPLVSIEPGGREFYVWPLLDDTHSLRMEWDGIRTDFTEDDPTPFDERVAEAVAKYVSATLVSTLPMQTSAGSPDLTAYRSLRRKLFIESCERSRIKRSR